MGDISLIEWIVYGLFAYSSGLILVISVITSSESAKPTRTLSVIRTVWMIPGMIASFFLASSGINITMPTLTTTTKTFVINGSTGALLTNSTTLTTQIGSNVLVNPVWMTFHLMLGLVLVAFILTQMLSLFFKTD